MQCTKCQKSVVYIEPTLCKEHFISYVEEKVYKTIAKHQLIKQNERIVVAASGGKDSLTLLYILSKKHKVDCIAIDEGIESYREKTLVDLENFCQENNINLVIISYKSAFGGDLGKFLTNNVKPCSVCGILRRYLLNKHAKDYDKLCTGHNLDDEAQAIIMNFLKPNIEMSARIGPITGIISGNGFVQRVKPFYFLKEREIVAYALLQGIRFGFNECPHAQESYRAKIRDLLNEYEAKYPGTKQSIINFFLKIQPKLKNSVKEIELNQCKCCGEPASGEVCNTCNMLGMITASNILGIQRGRIII